MTPSPELVRELAPTGELRAATVRLSRHETDASGHSGPGLAIEGSFATWAGTVLPDGAETLLVLDRAEDLWEATWGLLRIGYLV